MTKIGVYSTSMSENITTVSAYEHGVYNLVTTGEYIRLKANERKKRRLRELDQDDRYTGNYGVNDIASAFISLYPSLQDAAKKVKEKNRPKNDLGFKAFMSSESNPVDKLLKPLATRGVTGDVTTGVLVKGTDLAGFGIIAAGEDIYYI